MKQFLLFLLSMGGLYLLNGCGSGSSTPPPPVTTQLVVSPASSATTAGTAFNITVTAVGTSGTVDSTYSGTVHFASTDPQAVLPQDSKLSNGTGAFSVTLKTAGGQRVEAADSASPSISGQSSLIAVNAGSVVTLGVTAPSNAAAG